MAPRNKSWRSKIYQPGRAVYAAYEWAIMRLILAWVVYGAFRLAGYDALHWWSSPGRGIHELTKPLGIAQFTDVTWITDPANLPGFCAAVAISLAIFILGVAPFLSSLAMLVLHTFVGTLENSQDGNVYHTSQILCYAWLGICLGAAYDSIQALVKGGLAGWLEAQANRWRWLCHAAKRPRALVTRGGDRLEQWMEQSRSRMIYTAQQVIATAYVVAGVSKLWISKGAWISQVGDGIVLQAVKNQRNEYFESLDPSVVLPASVEMIANHPMLAKLFFAGGLFLELCCFLALFNRVFLALFGIGLIIMHWAIAELMHLYFDYYQWILLAFFVNIPFWVMLAWKRIQSKGAHVSSAGSPHPARS